MITFWVDQPGQFTIRNYLEGRGEAIRDRLQVQLYQWSGESVETRGGTHIFGALDQLSAPEREAVGALQAQLTARLPGTRLLNQAERCLLRPAMLAKLADEGVNSFRAYPAAEAGRVARFPVFVRGAYDHGGNLSALLHSAGQLRRALRALRLRGYRVADLLIVEFCDTRDAHGVYRKYAAYRLGDAILPAHIMAGAQWMLKADHAVRTLELAREDEDFIEQNPHQTWLRQAFDLAGIEFGRMDYGLLDGRPQVWEINTNPTIGRRPGKPPRDMSPEVTEIWKRTRELAHARLREAFLAVDRDAPGAPVRLPVEPALRARIAQAARERRWRQSAVRLLSRLYHSPLGAPFRVLLPRVDPRA